jgi:hypothetical protein
MGKLTGVGGKFARRRVDLDGHTFDSKREADRYSELKLMERAGLISDLELQPLYRIAINGVHCFKITFDFRYQRDGKTIVEDVKSTGTAKDPTFRVKKKVFEAQTGQKVDVVIRRSSKRRMQQWIDDELSKQQELL